MTLKVQILRCSRRLFIILVSLTMTLFSKKNAYFHQMNTWCHVQLDQKFFDGLYCTCLDIFISFAHLIIMHQIMLWGIHGQSQGPFNYYVRVIWGFYEPPKLPSEPAYQRTFSVNNVRENCNYLNDLPTPTSLHNSLMVPNQLSPKGSLLSQSA